MTMREASMVTSVIDFISERTFALLGFEFDSTMQTHRLIDHISVKGAFFQGGSQISYNDNVDDTDLPLNTTRETVMWRVAVRPPPMTWYVLDHWGVLASLTASCRNFWPVQVISLSTIVWIYYYRYFAWARDSRWHTMIEKGIPMTMKIRKNTLKALVRDETEAGNPEENHPHRQCLTVFDEFFMRGKKNVCPVDLAINVRQIQVYSYVALHTANAAK